MRLIILVMILSLGFISVGAEEYQDVVVFHDGSVIHGQITSLDKAQTVELTTREGYQFSYHYREVKSINGQAVRPHFLPKFLSTFRASYGFSTQASKALGVSFINGIRFNNGFALALGLGVDGHTSHKSYPLFLHTEMFFSNRNYSSFAFCNLGYAIKGKSYDVLAQPIDGKTLEIGVGLISSTNIGLDWIVDGGLRHTWTKSDSADDSWKTSDGINTIRFSLGILFH